jgi:hypothetical protein
MTLTTTKRELLALCFHVIGSQRQWTPEQATQRLKAWDDLGVRGLALDVSDMLTAPGMQIQIGEWMKRDVEVTCDISTGTLAFLVAQTNVAAATEHADYINSLREKLKGLAEAK